MFFKIIRHLCWRALSLLMNQVLKGVVEISLSFVGVDFPNLTNFEHSPPK